MGNYRESKYIGIGIWKSKFDDLSRVWENIKLSRYKKVKVILAKPELAIRLFDRFGDKQLGRLFITVYKSDLKYHSYAYDMSVELNQPIERRSLSQVVKECEEFENETKPEIVFTRGGCIYFVKNK